MSSGVNVLTKSRKSLNITNRKCFENHVPSEWQKNLIEVLSWKIHKFLGSINMLTFQWCYETGLFRHLSNHAFHNLWLRKNIRYEGHLFLWKCIKFGVHSRNWAKYSENIFRFFDNFIWIGCGKFSLLRKEYLPSAITVLTKCPMG